MTQQSDSQISRRAVLKCGLSGIVVAVTGVAARAAAQQKIAQSAVQYQATPKDGKECDMCLQFVAPNSCKVVDGTINPKGYCVAFTPKS